MTSQPVTKTGIWSPLSRPAFRALWLATCFAWIGGFMQDVAAAWLMTSLAPSPVMVALLQTAFNLPFFLLALPAGALSDLVDRRIVLISSQIWILLVVCALCALTVSGAMTPWLLLTLLLLVGIGAALNSPAFNSLAPELVPPGEVESAVALVAAGFNLMRGIGAAIGGVLVSAIGAGWVFALNAGTMLAIILVLTRLKRTAVSRTSPPEKVMGAMKAGMRYIKHSTPLHAVLMRTALFVFFSSCMWALLPLMAREHLGLTATQYGILISVFGLGNVAGASVVPRLRKSFSQDTLAALGTAFVASCMAMLAYVHTFPLAAIAMFGGGIGWITACAALNASLLNASPRWVRARVMSIFLLVFQGCLAGGAVIWGVLANFTSMVTALELGAAGLVLSLSAKWWFSLAAAERIDVSSGEAQAPPEFAMQPHPDHGPVVISVEYLIALDRVEEFNAAIAALEIKRRRDGAFHWHLYADLARPGHYIEMYQVETWGEYLRQIERTTAADKLVEERVYGIHNGEEAPKVTHLISERRRSKAARTKQFAKFTGKVEVPGSNQERASETKINDDGGPFIERRKS
jgi:MFS family permease